MDQRTHLLKEVQETLDRSGFQVSHRCGIRPSCFDLFARKHVLLLLLKVLGNIDGLTPEHAGDIQRMARMLSASPVLVGERTRGSEMEEGVLYERYGVPAVTPDTFEGIVTGGPLPCIISSQRGRYVNVDGEALKRMRQEQDMSIGEVARGIGVSKKAVYNYENAGTRASFETALKMEEFFDEPVALPVDILKRKGAPVAEKTGHQKGGPVMERLKEMGFQVEVIRKAPFDALTLESRDVMFTKVIKTNLRRALEKARIISSLSKTARTGAFFVSETWIEKNNIAGIPIIRKKELDRFEETGDLLSKVYERMPKIGS
jgi:putative transcriptional regulator